MGQRLSKFDRVAFSVLGCVLVVAWWVRASSQVGDGDAELRGSRSHAERGHELKWFPGETVRIEATGKQSVWHFRYAGPDGRLGTADDVMVRDVLCLPADADVELRLGSADFLYAFRVPQLAVNEIAVPELPRTVRFHTGKPFRADLLHDSMCGPRGEGDEVMGRIEVLANGTGSR